MESTVGGTTLWYILAEGVFFLLSRWFLFLFELRWHLHIYKRHNKYVWLYLWRITFSGHDTENWFEDALLASKSKQSHQYRIESAALKIYEHIEFNGLPVITKLTMRIREKQKSVCFQWSCCIMMMHATRDELR